MRLAVTVPDGEHNWLYLILPGCSDSQQIVVEGVVVLYIWKIHNHRYDLSAFFYASKRIVSRCSFVSKAKLHGAIQKLLQEELYDVVQ